MNRLTQRRYTNPGKINGTDGDFVCRHCGAYVTADAAISGVRNRNHCPYCLTSRHLDLFEAGDRLAACKATMHPIGLTTKFGNKKYRGQRELMLVHLCDECGQVAINRLARDDDTTLLQQILEESANLSAELLDCLNQQGIILLDTSQQHLVR